MEEVCCTSFCVERATERDVADWLALAAEVSDLFGADMASDPAFRESLQRNIALGTALCVRIDSVLAGAMLFKSGRIQWLAVAKQVRRLGVARALVAYAQSERRDVRVTTFGGGHPHPDCQAARRLYRDAGFQIETGMVAPGPDATPREALIWRAQ